MWAKINKWTIILAAVLLPAAEGISQEITVSNNGPVTSLQQAIELADSHDTITLQEGRYLESNVTVDKPLTIRGRGRVIIDGEHRGYVLIVKADRVTIKDLEIHGSKSSFIEDYAGILLEGVRDVLIENVTLEDNFFGIYLAKTADTVLRGNRLRAYGEKETSSGNGIHLWYSKNITIEDNYVTGHRDGVYFEFVEDVTILGNLSEENLRYGLHFMFSDRCRYERNTFRNNGAGVAVMYTDEVEMRENIFEHNWGSAAYGLLLKEIRDSIIEKNVFRENSIGMYLESTSRVVIRQNDFIQNGWAVKLMANSMNNEFTRNNFLSNTFEVATNSRQNFNDFNQNYWSQYEGYDLDRDGTGDVPYRPVRLFSILVEKQPQALILMRSLLISILDAAERFMPALTPETLVDPKPQMRKL